MKKLALAVSLVFAATSALPLAAEARPGRGHAYGHYKNGKAYGYAPYRGYYGSPYAYRRSNSGAVAAGVAGAIIGGALGAATRPSYGYYDRPSYGYYSAPRRYYPEEYYDDGY
jgi:hypothetical protein